MEERLIPLFTEAGVNLLKTKTVLVFGCGGVGSFAIEALARSGIGRLIIVDKDRVEKSNLNRQLIALHSTLNQSKVAVMKARVLDINPHCDVITYPMFYNFETKDVIWTHTVDFVFDAIDTVTFKLDIIKECLNRDIPFITSCGQGKRMVPEKVRIINLADTTYDPVAKAMRLHLRKRGIYKRVPCVFSEEVPVKTAHDTVVSSSPFVPPMAGLVAASYIVRKILEEVKQ